MVENTCLLGDLATVGAFNYPKSFWIGPFSKRVMPLWSNPDMTRASGAFNPGSNPGGGTNLLRKSKSI